MSLLQAFKMEEIQQPFIFMAVLNTHNKSWHNYSLNWPQERSHGHGHHGFFARSEHSLRELHASKALHIVPRWLSSRVSISTIILYSA